MITPKELLELSDSLYNQVNKSEAVLRNVTHTAYYAIYHEARAIGEKLPAIPYSRRRGGMHEQLIQKLRDSDLKEHKKLGKELSNLKDARVKADYNLSCKYPEPEARKILRKVKRLFESIEELEVDGTVEDDVLSKKNDAQEEQSSSDRPTLRVVK